MSKDFDCNFGEVAAADQVVEVRKGDDDLSGKAKIFVSSVT